MATKRTREFDVDVALSVSLTRFDALSPQEQARLLADAEWNPDATTIEIQLAQITFK